MIEISDISEKAHCVRHFFYFQAQSSAVAASKLLSGHGRETEIRQSGYNSQWQLLLCESHPKEEMSLSTYHAFVEVAESFDGEYDGWEYEIHNMIH